MDRELMYDVIVIGGGPAGSTAAYYLAKNEGLKILIADKADFPRHKACGGALGRAKDWPYEFDNYSEIKGKAKELYGTDSKPLTGRFIADILTNEYPDKIRPYIKELIENIRKCEWTNSCLAK